MRGTVKLDDKDTCSLGTEDARTGGILQVGGKLAEGMGDVEAGGSSDGRMMEVLECEAWWIRRSSDCAKVSPHRPQMYGHSCL